MAMRKLSTIQMFRNNRIWYNEKWLRVNKQWNINAIKDILRLKSKRTKMSALLSGTVEDLCMNWNTLKWRKLNVFGIMIICTLWMDPLDIRSLKGGHKTSDGQNRLILFTFAFYNFQWAHNANKHIKNNWNGIILMFNECGVHGQAKRWVQLILSLDILHH